MKEQPIIVVKKKGHGHHGHHGGAWKVAYADFVTAMMAFFLVMWIVGQSNPMKAGLARYFREPGAFTSGRGDASGVLPGAPTGVQESATTLAEEEAVTAAQAILERAAERLRSAFQNTPEFANIKDRIQIEVTPEGLRIELVDSSNESFFEVGQATLRPDTEDVLAVIAAELGRFPNSVAIEGHTDSRAFVGTGYGNWELSTERANAARRAMEQHGLNPTQIEGVRGFADRKPHFPDDPLNPRNRRVSIVVHNTV